MPASKTAGKKRRGEISALRPIHQKKKCFSHQLPKPAQRNLDERLTKKKKGGG